MENKSHAWAAGVFVIAVAALLAALAMWLSRDHSSYNRYELSSRESVTGLQPQAAVRYKGVNVGKVLAIGFDPQTPGNVLIRIAVDTDAPIGATTFATLGYQGVTGLAHIQLDDAASALTAPTPGPSGLPRLPLQPSQLSRLVEQGPQLLGQAQDIMERVARLLDEGNQQRVDQALEHIGQAASSMQHLAASLDRTTTERLDPLLAQLPALISDSRQSLQALRQASEHAGGAAQSIEQTVQALNREGGALDGLTDSAQALSGAIDRLARVTLPRVNRAAGDTSAAARRIGRAAAGISDNPQQLIYGPDTVRAGPGEPGFEAPGTAAGAQP
ncbi:MlaD family protein [Comamonas faecalis]|uniref:MlaD family protein n=1 Tax=Comamonas faecalis TaxID=1387849 RepID=A0ABP7RL51_9BURK